MGNLRYKPVADAIGQKIQALLYRRIKTLTDNEWRNQELSEFIRSLNLRDAMSVYSRMSNKGGDLHDAFAHRLHPEEVKRFERELEKLIAALHLGATHEVVVFSDVDRGTNEERRTIINPGIDPDSIEVTKFDRGTSSNGVRKVYPGVDTEAYLTQALFPEILFDKVWPKDWEVELLLPSNQPKIQTILTLINKNKVNIKSLFNSLEYKSVKAVLKEIGNTLQMQLKPEEWEKFTEHTKELKKHLSIKAIDAQNDCIRLNDLGMALNLILTLLNAYEKSLKINHYTGRTIGHSFLSTVGAINSIVQFSVATVTGVCAFSALCLVGIAKIIGSKEALEYSLETFRNMARGLDKISSVFAATELIEGLVQIFSANLTTVEKLDVGIKKVAVPVAKLGTDVAKLIRPGLKFSGGALASSILITYTTVNWLAKEAMTVDENIKRWNLNKAYHEIEATEKKIVTNYLVLVRICEELSRIQIDSKRFPIDISDTNVKSHLNAGVSAGADLWHAINKTIIVIRSTNIKSFVKEFSVYFERDYESLKKGIGRLGEISEDSIYTFDSIVKLAYELLNVMNSFYFNQALITSKETRYGRN